MTPLERAEKLLVEMDRVLSLPGAQSASARIDKFRTFLEGFRETVAFQQGYRAEHEQLSALVSNLLAVLTTRSPHLSRAIREIDGLRSARDTLIEYIERAKSTVPVPETKQ